MPWCHWQDPEGQATIKQIVKVKIPTFRGAAMHSVRYQARGAHFWYFAARLRMLNLPRSSQVARLVQLEQEFLDGWSCMWSFMLSGSLWVRQPISLWTVSPTSCVAHEDKLGYSLGELWVKRTNLFHGCIQSLCLVDCLGVYKWHLQGPKLV